MPRIDTGERPHDPRSIARRVRRRISNVIAAWRDPNQSHSNVIDPRDYVGPQAKTSHDDLQRSWDVAFPSKRFAARTPAEKQDIIDTADAFERELGLGPAGK